MAQLHSWALDHTNFRQDEMQRRVNIQLHVNCVPVPRVLRWAEEQRRHLDSDGVIYRGSLGIAHLLVKGHHDRSSVFAK